MGSKKIRVDLSNGGYEISCGGCDAKYIGQTARRCIDRYKEHERAYRLNHPDASAMAAHCIEKGHKIGEFKLLKEVRNEIHLDAWESLLISRGKDLVNKDDAPISSSLFTIDNATA